MLTLHPEALHAADGAPRPPRPDPTGLRTILVKARLAECDSVTVRLHYQGGQNGYARTVIQHLDGGNPAGVWRLGDFPVAGTLRYSAQVVLRDGECRSIAERTTRADIIDIDPYAPEQRPLRIAVDASAIDWRGQRVESLELVLRYGDREQAHLFLGDAADLARIFCWERIAGLEHFSWRATYRYRSGGRLARLTIPEQHSHDRVLQLPSLVDLELAPDEAVAF